MFVKHGLNSSESSGSGSGSGSIFVPFSTKIFGGHARSREVIRAKAIVLYGYKGTISPYMSGMTFLY